MTIKDIFTIASAICAIIFGYLAFTRNKSKDEEEESRESGTLLSDIGYIKSGVDDIKNEQKEQRKTNLEVVSRLTKVEESVKQAHKRIDELKGEKNNA